MAEHKVQGSDMLLFIDPAGGTAYSMVVCLTSLGKSDTVAVVDASSACGPDKSPGTLELSYTFEGQHLQDPSGQLSGTDLRILLRNKTEIGWLISPIAPEAGDEIESGVGYLSDLSSTYAFDSVGTFSGTFQPYGLPTLSISGGGGGGLVVGQAYQGGTIAYLDGTGLHGIIAAWTDSTHTNIWGGTGYVVGATFDTLYNGVVNSDLIALAYVGVAAWDCTDLTQNGYSDWCLPTATDWYAMQGNYAILGIDPSATYWTSIENSGDADNAIGFSPGINSGLITNKLVNGPYIAVRYF